MKTLSLRGIDDDTAEALKNIAKQGGVSINKTVLNLLKASLKPQGKRRNVLYHDVDELAGTWSKKDELRFKEKTKTFNVIEKDLWK
jgi:plasmid stability protein